MNDSRIGLHVPEILLPGEGTDMQKWAVVACDQYTSQPEYWERAGRFVNHAPSTLNMILPEVFLETPKEAALVSEINENMNRYLENNILIKQPPGFILVDRKTSTAVSRKGLVVALDLEHYDFQEGAGTLIRATEGTIMDRLPPRIKVRKNAPVELPHIMVLIDDPGKTVIEPLFEKGFQKVYDFDLMMGSGHIRGFRVDDAAAINRIAEKLAILADPETFSRKYGVEDKPVLLYAMGDGNHSFATAKAIWEELKKEAGASDKIMSHPARYALVELVNLHDEGLEFEPIHRVMFGIETQDLIDAMHIFYADQGSEISVASFNTITAAEAEAQKARQEGWHAVTFVSSESAGLLTIKNPNLTLEVATLQAFIDAYLESRSKVKIDYVHGKDVVLDLGKKPGNMGFFLEAMSKHDLFKTIILDGALPRKTFSMGAADEKRFYLEARKITA